MDATPTSSRPPVPDAATARTDIVAGLVSSTVAIPLAMAFGMFAFVSLGDGYFAYGAMTGLISAVIAGVTCVLLGDRSTRVYAPRITTTFFLGLLLFSLLHRDDAANASASVPAALLALFAIILLGGLLQALFGLLKLGTLINPVTRRCQVIYGLLIVLVYSRHAFLWPLTQQTVEATIDGLEQGWKFFGALARRLVDDCRRTLGRHR